MIALYLTNLFFRLSPQPQVGSTILAPLFHIRSLKNLSISDNNIQGEIPGVGFANLSNLVLLDMSGNNFKGSIPPQLFGLPYLRELYLDDSSLTGKLLPDDEETEKYVISSTSKLQVLSLSGNKFSDGMLLSILCLKGLEFLDLSYNDLLALAVSSFLEFYLSRDLALLESASEVRILSKFCLVFSLCLLCDRYELFVEND